MIQLHNKTIKETVITKTDQTGRVQINNEHDFLRVHIE